MDEKSTSRPMNLMHGAFAIGAVVGPIVLGFIMASGLSWTLLFRAISVLFAALGIVLSIMPFAKLGSAVQESAGARPAPTSGETRPIGWASPACSSTWGRSSASPIG